MFDARVHRAPPHMQFGDVALDGRFTNAVCEDIDMLLQTDRDDD